MGKELLEAVKKEVAEGRVKAQRHPTLPLTIYKYSTKTAYNREWNVTNLRCRGLVLDEDGEIVVNSMPKFFNHSEPENEGLDKKAKYTVTDKLDGSLIQVANWKGELIVTSSGSFTSAQAEKARKMLGTVYSRWNFDNRITYLFEIIYPENKIVLDYGNQEFMRLLAMRETATGKELTPDSEAFDVVEKTSKTIEEIEAELNRKDFINKEGYVVHFEDGIRVKYKYSKYMYLHKLVSGVNETFVWEHLRTKSDIKEVIDNVPDEIFNWFNVYRGNLLNEYEMLKLRAENTYSDITKNLPDGWERKDFAEMAKTHGRLQRLLFLLLDKKDIEDSIWQMIKPKNNTKWGMGDE